MRRSPGFAIAVALTLGIGIGVNGAIFGYVNNILLRPLPARDADELVGVFQRETRSGNVRSVGYDDYVDFRDRSGAFASLAGFVEAPVNMTPASGGDAGNMVWGEMVTEDFFSVLQMLAGDRRRRSRPGRARLHPCASPRSVFKEYAQGRGRTAAPITASGSAPASSACCCPGCSGSEEWSWGTSRCDVAELVLLPSGEMKPQA